MEFSALAEARSAADKRQAPQNEPSVPMRVGAEIFLRHRRSMTVAVTQPPFAGSSFTFLHQAPHAPLDYTTLTVNLDNKCRGGFHKGPRKRPHSTEALRRPSLLCSWLQPELQFQPIDLLNAPGPECNPVLVGTVLR